MKIVCIGASYKFVKRIVNDFILCGEFEDSELVVVDILQEPLDIVVAAAKKIIEISNSRLAIWGTLDRKKALDKADFVVVSIGVGGLEAIKKDMSICSKYGIYQQVGDTIGPVAIATSLRIIPVMLQIAKDMERICPDAWMINVSNPMTSIIKAVSDYSKVKVIGLCHGTTETGSLIAKAYGVKDSDITYESVGVNHLVFSWNICIKGKKVDANFYEDMRNGLSEDKFRSFKLGLEFYKLTNYFPMSEDTHFADFLPQYIPNLSQGGYECGVGILDIDSRIERRNKLEQYHKDIVSGKITRVTPTDYSGEDIHGIILSLYYGRDNVYIVNIPNNDISKDLKEGSVIETRALISKDRVNGIKIPSGSFDSYIRFLVYYLNTMYDLIAEAAVTGDSEKIQKALLLDPAVRHLDIINIVPDLLTELIASNRKYLTY